MIEEDAIPKVASFHAVPTSYSFAHEILETVASLKLRATRILGIQTLNKALKLCSNWINI